MVVGTAIQRLGSTPSPKDVMQYMEALGLQHKVVGTSIQGRDLVLYQFPRPSSQRRQKNKNKQAHEWDEEEYEQDHRNVPTVLFLSLVHGNEPMGLISLLTTAHILAEGSTRLRTRRGAAAADDDEAVVRLLFFPIVNIDGYVRNLDCAAGNHRGNMRVTSCETTSSSRGGYRCSADKAIPPVGVDLNRNFPMDWNGTYSNSLGEEESNADACSMNYRGEAPFSEPETRAIQQVVTDYNVVAAMSFHSLRSKARRKALLIHPYTSMRPFQDMPAEHAAKFRAWAKALNANGLYKVGTAKEAIEYTAGGTTIDWLYGAHNVTAFVFEVVPVCDNRWCPATPRLYRSARDYGNIGRRLVELVVHGKVVQDVDSIQRSIGFLLFLLIVWIMWTWKMPLTSFLRRRLYGKFKDVSLSEAEMQNLKN